MEIACDDLLEGRGPDLSSEFQKLPDISQAQAEQMAQRAIGQCQDSKANQQEQLGDLFSLITSPGSIVFSLVLGQGLGLILVAILTSSVIGTEHSWGTVRPLLVKGVRRWHMLASKLAMVALAFAASLLVVGVLGLITGQLLGGLLSGTEGLENSSSWGDVAEVLGKAWFSVLPYAALVGLVTVATRSSATGMGVGRGTTSLSRSSSASSSTSSTGSRGRRISCWSTISAPSWVLETERVKAVEAGSPSVVT